MEKLYKDIKTLHDKLEGLMLEFDDTLRSGDKLKPTQKHSLITRSNLLQYITMALYTIYKRYEREQEQNKTLTKKEIL